MSNQPKITCSNVWKLFGSDEKRIIKDLDKNLSIKEVQEKTGHVVAVKDVSFSIEKGETFVVMGLSGSGKSTLVRCISRLIEPTAGTVKMDDVDVTKMSGRELLDLRRNKMSMVFQHFGLFPHRTVIENIGYGLEVRGAKKDIRIEKSMEVLKMVGLDGWHNNYPRELSGGMQQRVGLARALAVDPEILIFDEPFSALDPLIRREMQDELLKIQEKLQKTMVFITHDFLEAIKMGDHIAIMKDGEVSQVGTPEEIVSNPKDQYVKDFCEDVPKYKVLSAGKVMRTECCNETKNLFENGKDNILDNSKIENLIDRLIDNDKTYPVVCNESGKLLGEIDRVIVMKSMRSNQ
ncbi:betaine/proline/choline family ABC transporter ATP-binding protein [Candidatus Pelagibacter sp.]|nr:betaine/proline/choline family ABC transporter ATP-binding protein [Candidatus Pelagibacter sp.]